MSYFTLAVGIFTWYDSISRIGASKEVLIAGPLEIVIIVVLARIFLKEKLVQTQVIGIILALMGSLMAVASDVNVLNGRRIQTEITTPSMIVTFGDIEAILSAFGFGIGVLFSTKLVSRHSSMKVAVAPTSILGLISIGLMSSFLYESDISSSDGFFFISTTAIDNPIIILILFSLLPFIGFLCYSTGLSIIGTSIIGSNRVYQYSYHDQYKIILKELGIKTNLPENLSIEIVGGVLGFLGIYIINLNNNYLPINISKKQ